LNFEDDKPYKLLKVNFWIFRSHFTNQIYYSGL